jgi:hypothetical protein
MSKRQANVAELSARAKAEPEEAQGCDDWDYEALPPLFGRYDRARFVTLECLKSDLRHGDADNPIDPDYYPLLAEIVDEHILAKRRGGLSKSPQARAAAKARNEEIYAWGRERRAHHQSMGEPRKQATQFAIRDLRDEFPAECGELKDETIRYRLSRY